eukprot:TRINITY_DN2892_c0_g1_i1.p1 TRINITY_DN2892_c0_g1~~TRINITY_DN2892_c0_g1_i1.p1  ORF type:complete len:125 (-),score=19.13 TRINITY_DN2892_c0_g1_i1:33-407(-)
MDDDEQMDDVASVVPTELKQLRACLNCSLVKTADQFLADGCQNCDFLEMRDERQRVFDCTSSNFSGFVAITDMKSSWIAKWQRIDRLTPGCYALSVAGRLPRAYVRQMEAAGQTYMPRESANPT